MNEAFELCQGKLPLLVSFPHDGREIPAEIAARMTEAGRASPDTDHWVARLYDFVEELGASRIVARYSRYVVDLNRDPSGASLYPGSDTTGLCPVSTFAQEAIYQPGREPSPEEVVARRQRYFEPYHQQLEVELERLRARFGRVVLFDAHSIRSVVPRFFSGVLPDLNLGTNSGKSADEELATQVFHALLRNEGGFSAVRDERFRGGYITRRYGAPQRGVSALQLEMAQKTYMGEAPPFEFDEARANEVRPVLRKVLQICIDYLEVA